MAQNYKNMLIYLFFLCRQGGTMYPLLAWDPYVDQAGFELTVPPISASPVLGLKMCATMSGLQEGI